MYVTCRPATHLKLCTLHLCHFEWPLSGAQTKNPEGFTVEDSVFRAIGALKLYLYLLLAFDNLVCVCFSPIIIQVAIGHWCNIRRIHLLLKQYYGLIWLLDLWGMCLLLQIRPDRSVDVGTLFAAVGDFKGTRFEKAALECQATLPAIKFTVCMLERFREVICYWVRHLALQTIAAVAALHFNHWRGLQIRPPRTTGKSRSHWTRSNLKRRYSA